MKRAGHEAARVRSIEMYVCVALHMHVGLGVVGRDLGSDAGEYGKGRRTG